MQEHKAVNILEKFKDSPSILTYLNKHFADGNTFLQNTLLDKVDESEFSLREWVESLLVMDQWLEQNGRKLSAENSIEYVSCATAAVGKNPNLCHLPSVVNDFLEQYGCEMAINK